MKKYLFLLTLCFLGASLWGYSLGDVNHSGSVDILDALLTAQYYVGLFPQNFDPSLGDVDAQSGITAVDALLIAQYYVGFITEFPGQVNNCPADGGVVYTLNRVSSPSQDQLEAYGLITEAMDKAVQYYNCYTNLSKQITASYVPSVPTADGNINGSIRFGSRTYMNHITAMHEIAHTLGIGTSYQWQNMVSGGIFTGINATNQLRAITGNNQDQLHADSQHFWPYGLNYTSEVSGEEDLINHCRIVAAILLDLGI